MAGLLKGKKAQEINWVVMIILTLIFIITGLVYYAAMHGEGKSIVEIIANFFSFGWV